MSECENIDGQCAASWCDCDYQRRKRRSLAPAPGSAAHVRMDIMTPRGNVATILGDPNMPLQTMDALAETIDAAIKAANEGTLKVPPND